MDKPLHVQVAEALGTVNSQEVPPFYYVTPRYDTDWSATGPLIEKYGIRLYVFAGEQGWGAGCAVRKDGAIALPGEQAYDIHTPPVAAGPTPPIAVCNLILALKAAGKL